jgi:hypothetical protein
MPGMLLFSCCCRLSPVLPFHSPFLCPVCFCSLFLFSLARLCRVPVLFAPSVPSFLLCCHACYSFTCLCHVPILFAPLVPFVSPCLLFLFSLARLCPVPVLFASPPSFCVAMLVVLLPACALFPFSLPPSFLLCHHVRYSCYSLACLSPVPIFFAPLRPFVLPCSLFLCPLVTCSCLLCPPPSFCVTMLPSGLAILFTHCPRRLHSLFPPANLYLLRLLG